MIGGTGRSPSPSHDSDQFGFQRHRAQTMPAPPRSHDALPSGAIRLSVAFERYYRATSPDAAAIQAELNAAYADIENAWQALGAGSARQLKAAMARWRAASMTHDASLTRAELSFRNLLAVGRLIARVRDPATGEILQLLDHESWNKRSSFGVPGFTDDFVGPDELMQPGPSGATIGGFLRPVFFILAEFEALLPAGADVVAKIDQPEHDRREHHQPEQDRWPIPEQEPKGIRQAAAWRIAKRAFGNEGGPLRSLGWATITNLLNARRLSGDARITEDTVARMFKDTTGPRRKSRKSRKSRKD
jgi:hypothetical protein